MVVRLTCQIALAQRGRFPVGRERFADRAVKLGDVVRPTRHEPLLKPCPSELSERLTCNATCANMLCVGSIRQAALTTGLSL